MATVLTLTLPFFGLIFCGYLAARRGWVGEGGAAGINTFVILFALPAFVFSRVTGASEQVALEPGFLLAYGAATLAVFAIGIVVSRALFRLPTEEAVLQGMGSAFSNTGYMGLPLAVAAFGEAAVIPAVLTFGFDNTLLLLLVLVVLEARRAGGVSMGGLAHLLGQVVLRNPLVVAIVVAVAVSMLRLPVPEALANFARLLGNAAGPGGLFTLGVGLASRSVGSGVGPVGTTTLLKLFAHPVLVWAGMSLAQPDPLWATVAILSAALPVGATVFVVSAQYHVQAARASSTVLVTTVISVVTVSVLLAVLSVAR